MEHNEEIKLAEVKESTLHHRHAGPKPSRTIPSRIFLRKLGKGRPTELSPRQLAIMKGIAYLASAILLALLLVILSIEKKAAQKENNVSHYSRSDVKYEGDYFYE